MDSLEGVEIRRRSRQRHMHLTVRRDGGVRVSCNRKRSAREILAFVKESADFIARRRAEIAKEHAAFPPKAFLSGETFLLEGVPRRLEVIWTFRKRATVRLTGTGHLELLAPVESRPIDRQKALEKFFRERARERLIERVRHWSEAMGLTVTSLTVRGQKTLWGSCSGPADISLNWKLICAPPLALDYVVIHELAHIHERNHSPRFWQTVARFSPDWRAQKSWLRAHELKLAREFCHE